MKIIFYQPVTDKTDPIVSDRYHSLGWGLDTVFGSMDRIVARSFIWCSDEPYELPDVSDLGLPAPHKL